ncbi:MAG: histidinol-phosphate transaminase [Rikenellaceae bacterium]
MMNLNKILRPNIASLAPYSTARDEYEGGEIATFLDANESPYDTGLNRYPDPHLKAVRWQLAKIKGVKSDQIFVGNGSDEAIDLVFRLFCTPAKDNVVIISPSYGMYKVAAEINDIEVREVVLNEDFSLDADALLNTTDQNTKAIFICSPNNPTANLLDRAEVERLLKEFHGVVVVDEAYIDFAQNYRSFSEDLALFDNLIVLQTLSKAWGLAGVRFGMAFASKEIVAVMNKVKYPYNINILTQRLVLEKLTEYQRVKDECKVIIAEREMLISEFSKIEKIEKVYPSDANFILIKVADANKLYDYLVDNGVIVRNRNSVTLCKGCLRITVGTSAENQQLVNLMRNS